MAAQNVTAAIRAHLIADAGVTAIVGQRVYVGAAMEQAVTVPAVTVEQIAGDYLEDLQGPAGYSTAVLEVSAYAATQAGAWALAQAVDNVLRAGAGTMGGLAVLWIQRDNLTELTDQRGDRIERRVIASYSIDHQEA